MVLLEVLFLETKNYVMDIKRLKDRYSQLKTEKDRYTSVWEDISLYCDYTTKLEGEQDNKGQVIDFQAFDSTAIESVSTAAEALLGIMWNSSINFRLLPTYEINNTTTSPDELKKYYDYATIIANNQIVDNESNFKGILKSVFKDLVAFGTGGIGVFKNKEYALGNTSNFFNFISYGIDNVVIDEGMNEKVTVVYVKYKWRIQKIIDTFCMIDSEFNEEKFNKFPDEYKEAYHNDKNKEFEIMYCLQPNNNYSRGLKGKKGHKYIGVWFTYTEETEIEIEHFRNIPIIIARHEKIRTEIYGTSPARKCLSSIRQLNSYKQDSADFVDKSLRPALGIHAGSLGGDGVIDVSAGSITTFDKNESAGSPIFPLHDMGDPTAMIQFSIPELKDAITKMFKIDVLLDFNSSQEMTATEVRERSSIRSKQLIGLLEQYKNELFLPLIERCVNMLMANKMLGINSETDPEDITKNISESENKKEIPQEILGHLKSGKKWFNIVLNSEISKIEKQEEMNSLNQLLMITGSIAQMYPEILQTVDFYKMLNKINLLLNNDTSIIKSKDDFEKALKQQAQLQQQALISQAQNQQSETNKNNSESINKLNNG